MAVDLFASFDDNNINIISSNSLMWGYILILLAGYSSSYWVSFSRSHSTATWCPLSSIMPQSLRSFAFNLGGLTATVTALFLFLIFINLMSLIPYVFGVSAQLALSFSLALPIWLSLVISSFSYNPPNMLAGLLPSGAPGALSAFLVIVETISTCVRPLTVSIRLVANITAGHVVLSLLGTYLGASLFSQGSPHATAALVSIQTFYFLFEVGVSFIQAYIFSLLILLYSDDHPKDTSVLS